MPPKEFNKGWLLLAVTLLAIGLSALILALNTDPIPTDKYLDIPAAERIYYTPQDNYNLNLYGGIGFFIGGLIALAVMLVARRS